MDKFKKQSGERLDYDFDCAPAFSADSDELTGATTVADPGITIEDTVINPEANIVKVWVSGGISGEKYKVTVTAISRLGRVVEGDFIIQVKDI